MRRRLQILAVPLFVPLLLAGVVLAQNGAADAQRASNLLQEAIHFDEVVGDLEAAITLYRRVADEFPTERSLAARALVRLGACYERLGDEQARQAYERVIRDFADQGDLTTTASTRLAALDAAATRVEPSPSDGAGAASRDVPLPEIEPDGGGVAGLLRLSPDGHRALFYSVGGKYTGQNVAVYDYASKATTFLTTHRWDTPEQPLGVAAVWSPDGTRVAYSTVRKPGADATDVGEIFVATPGQEPRRLFATEEGAAYVTDWLRDGSALVVALQRRDQSVSLGLVSLSDGSFSRLRTLQWSQATYPRASPDGRYIVFEDGSREARDLFLITSDGRSVVSLDEHPALDTQPLWSPDGRHVVFHSNRQGRAALWAVAVEDGRAAGRPFMVMPEADRVGLRDWTDRGIAYLRTRVVTDVYTAAIDPASGETIEGPRMIPYASTGWNHSPIWSPDGRMIAFISGDRLGQPRHQTVVVLPLDGNPPREATPPEEAFTGISNIRWKPDGTELSVNSRDRQNRPVLLRLTLEDLQWTVQPLPDDLWYNYLDWDSSWSEFFYYSLRPGIPDQAAFDEAGLFKADVETGEHERLWQPPVHPIRGIRTSPGGRHIAFTILGRIWIFDLEEKTARQIPDVAAVPFLSWSPDSRYVFYKGIDHPGTDDAEGSGDPGDLRMRMLDVATGESVVLATGESLIDGTGFSLGTPVMAPDGRSIAFSVGGNWIEWRLLEDPLAGTEDGRSGR
jgi:Tol biopolymer transport system component